jgi:hypothetical protein
MGSSRYRSDVTAVTEVVTDLLRRRGGASSRGTALDVIGLVPTEDVRRAVPVWIQLSTSGYPPV